MIKKLLFISAFLLTTILFGQEKTQTFKKGEWLRYKMSYSGFLKAGNAVLKVEETELNGKTVYHATGKGNTTGMIKWFFKVEDTYESYFDKKTTKPYLFKRDVNEGGYTIKRNITFDQPKNKAIVEDLKHKTKKEYPAINVLDMISSFYYLRNQNTSNLKPGEEIKLNMFFDATTNPFKLLYVKNEVLKTKFGEINTMVFKPIVQSGRVFKKEESVTIWITADENKIPVKINASLAVGSLRAELDAYKGLANSFKIIYNK